ncbi:MAG: signal peptidase I [Verrucomicrobiota bacterium]|jgi:signal peptidase I
MNLRWLVSKTVRQAVDLRQQVIVILNSQRDILAPKALAEATAALKAFDEARARHPNDATLEAEVKKLEEAATKWFQPYPNAGTRENLKEFLVSGVLILTIFSFFVQPMKIPSGSAQPTLYGNVVTDLRTNAQITVPDRWGRFLDWFRGLDYHVWVAKDGGTLHIEPVTTSFGFIKQQRFLLGNDAYTFWWPVDHLAEQCGVSPGQEFKAGDTVLKLRVRGGDRLFVDRLTYNFRRPERGEIIVFHTVDIDHTLRVWNGYPVLTSNTHYIKRLVGLSGEKVRIGNDRHVIINGERLDATTRRFEHVYSFTGKPRDSVYSGHVNDLVSVQTGLPARKLAPLFPDENTEFEVRPNYYLALGDNTMNSFDGRGWGDFPREHVVGRALFVFWPFTSRFGLVYQ